MLIDVWAIVPFLVGCLCSFGIGMVLGMHIVAYYYALKEREEQ